MRIKVDIFSCFGFFFLDLGFSFTYTVLMHREEIYVQKKKHISISDLYSDGNEDKVATLQIFRNRGHGRVKMSEITKRCKRQI